MFEDALGRLIGGALWGAGAGLLMTVASGGGGLRSVAKGLVKGSIAVADRVQETTAEMRDGLQGLTADARAERGNRPETSANAPR